MNKIYLSEEEMPTHWYNIQADMPNQALPPLHPGTKQPVGPEDLSPLFPMELIKQEVSKEIGDESVPTCCQTSMTRVWSAIPAIFKTGGFYKTGG